MTPAILQPGTLPHDVAAKLAAVYAVHRVDRGRDVMGLAPDVRSEVRGIATRSMVGADAALMAALPRLEIVAVFGAGLDAVDLDAARARGIRVTHTPDVLTEDTGEYAIALVLALLRRVVEGDRFVRAGRWASGALPNSTRVRGRRLGIVGLGRIGLAVARRATALGMQVAWHGPHDKPEIGYPFHADLRALARAVDVLLLTCPGGRATERMVDAGVLDALGPQGFLVNIARGSVVDESALVAALAERRIAGAALDVFRDEPNVPAALLGMEQVIVAPHIASTTEETRREIGELMLANLAAHFAGRPLPSAVL